MSYRVLYILALMSFTSLQGAERPDASTVFRAEAPGTAFLTGETLRFHVAENTAAPARWTLRDWRENTLRNGDWKSGAQALELQSLPCGYYLLAAEAADGTPYPGVRSFTVLPVPVAAPEGFFALDTSQSWLAAPKKENPRHPANAYEVASDLAFRSGAAMIRERMRWRDVEKHPGQYDWMQYQVNANLLAERGVAISGMYHDAPAWAKTNTERLPGDLFALHRFNRELAGQFRGNMKNWEFWNEQDHHFSTESAWDYASALKAAYLGFKAGDPELSVAIGGIAITSLKHYNDVVMANGASDYFDIFNVHTYQPLRDYPQLLRNIHAFRAKYDLLDRPLWFTENGCRAEGNGQTESFLKGIKAHSFEQELIVAEYIPKMMLYLQSLGVDRDFVFVLLPFNEQAGGKDWGLARRDFSVKPAYTAFANLAAGLGRARLEGELKVADSIRAFLYRQPDGSQSLAYFSLSELDLEPEVNYADRSKTELHKRSFSLPFSESICHGVDIFGTPFALQANNGKVIVTASRMLSRLDGLSGLKPDIPFQAMRKSKATPAANMDRSIVCRVELSDDFELMPARDRASVAKEKVAFTLQIFNFSDSAKQGHVEIHGGAVEALPESVRLPAFGKIELPLRFTPDWGNGSDGVLRVEGEFEGERISPLVAPLLNFRNFLASGTQKPFPRMADAANWRQNSAGKMTIRNDASESAIRFEVEFPPGVDRWVYPEYALSLPEESLKESCGLVFEVKAEQNPDKIRRMVVMGVEGPIKLVGKPHYLPGRAPSTEWEERVIWFDHPGLDPARLKALRFGFNVDANQLVYYIRNVRILYKNK